VVFFVKRNYEVIDVIQVGKTRISESHFVEQHISGYIHTALNNIYKNAVFKSKFSSYAYKIL
jgi:hypothetical protein